MLRSLSPPRFVFAILAIIGAGQLFSGCTKTDPLDEPVDARTMSKFMRWQERRVRPLGEPIVSEFDQALRVIAQQTPGYKVPSTREDFNSPFNTLCLRIDGMSLRNLIIEGYEMTNATIRDRVFIDRLNTDTMRIRMNNENLDFRRAIARQEAAISHWEDRLRRNEARIRDLRGGPP